MFCKYVNRCWGKSQFESPTGIIWRKLTHRWYADISPHSVLSPQNDMTTHKILRLRCVKYFVLFDFISFINIVLLDFEACLINGQFVIIGIRLCLILIAYRFYLIGFYLPLSSFCHTGLAVFEHKWNILKTFLFYLNGELSNNRTHQTGGIVSRRKSNGDYKIARKYFWFERKGDKLEIKNVKVAILFR